jgi:hypothetical protein
MAMAAGTTTGPPPVTLFYSYAREDEPLRQKLENQLAALRRAGLIAEWHDRKIEGGEDWAQEIDRNLQLADIVLLLVSADFIASDYCWGNEMGTALARHQRGEAKAVPVILRPCQWRETPMASLQAVPEDGKPVTAWDDEDEAFNDVAASIGRIVRAMHVRTARNGDPQSRARPEGGRSGWSADARHEQLAARLLGAKEAEPFFEALKDELEGNCNPKPMPETPAETVRCFIQWATDGKDIEQLFDAVHAALISLGEPAGQENSARRDVEEAAAALYCLAACLLVDCEAHRSGEFVIRVPRTEPVICAIIATALFGGELRLKPAEGADLPGAEYVVPVPLPPAGPNAEDDFERHAYVALFWGSSDAPDEALDSGRLNDVQRNRLIVRLRKIRNRQKRSLALVVRGVIDGEPYRRFALGYRVPVMVPGDEAASALLRIPAARLRAHIEEFWADIHALREAAPGPAGQSPSGSGAYDEAGPPSGSFSFGDNATVIFGHHSAAKPGARTEHHEGVDPAVLVEVLRNLAQVIDANAAPADRPALAQHLETARDEAAKTKPDHGRVRRVLEGMLDIVKKGGEASDSGGKIVAACYKAYTYLAPVCGWPPLP